MWKHESGFAHVKSDARMQSYWGNNFASLRMQMQIRRLDSKNIKAWYRIAMQNR